MTQIEEARERLHRLVEEYVEAEAQLKALEADEFRVCIFGSARIRPEDPTYQTVRRLACSLGELGIDIVTGGGPGLMEAANLGVQEAKNRGSLSSGLPIELPAAPSAAAPAPGRRWRRPRRLQSASMRRPSSRSSTLPCRISPLGGISSARYPGEFR